MSQLPKDHVGTPIIDPAVSGGALIVVGYAPPVDTIARVSASRLVDLVATTAPDGTMVFVRSVRDWFVLHKTSALVSDNITIADAIGGGRWLRKFTPSVRWLTQAAWTLDPAAADDEGDGSGGDPLKTHAELGRRAMDQGRTLPQSVMVTIIASLPDADPINIDVRFDDADTLLHYVGTPTTVRSGTLTGVTALVAGTTLTAIVDGVGGAFAVGNRVRMTAGASIGAIGWVVRVSDGACSPFTTINTTSAPVSGAVVMSDPTTDDYVVETLDAVGLGKLSQAAAPGSGPGTQQIVFEHLDVGSSDAAQLAQLDPGVLLAHCRMDAANFDKSTFAVSGCFHVSAASVAKSTVTYRANAFTGVVSLVGSQASLASENVVMGGPSFGAGSDASLIKLATVGGFEALSVHDAASVGVRVERTSQFDAAAVLWGSGNTSFGIDAGGQLFYAAADKPTITGGGATDTSVGGVDKDYADIPFFNAINGAAIVEAE